MELTKLINSREDDDKTEVEICELSIRLDDIGDEIKRLEKAKTIDDER